jgi:hypothetical protein
MRSEQYIRSGQYINFLSPMMTSNEKRLKYKVVDLVETYKFHIQFISIRVQTKSYNFLKTN